MKIIILSIIHFYLAQASSIIGVPPQNQNLYKGQEFACLNSKEHTVPNLFINDNYCDCPDGSDEPGTSACNFQFFCENKQVLQKQIPSSKVNDGVCDCCDASDEYLTKACQDTCQEEVSRQNERNKDKKESIRRGIINKYKNLQASFISYNSIEGEIQDLEQKLKKEQESLLVAEGNLLTLELREILQSQYNFYYQVLEGQKDDLESQLKQKQKVLNFDYGPINEFFHLEGKCLKYEDQQNQYEYKICFFDNANQRQIADSSFDTVIGKFQKFDKNYSQIIFGEGQHCFGSISRSLTMDLECGEEDKITKFSEPEVCQYKAIFKTPAVCSIENIKELY